MFNRCPAPVHRFNRFVHPVVAATLATALLPACTYPRHDGDDGRPTASAPASKSAPACSDTDKRLNDFVYPVHLTKPYGPVDATAMKTAFNSAASLYMSRNHASVSVDIEVENIDRDDAAGQAALQVAAAALRSELQGEHGIVNPRVSNGVVGTRVIEQSHPPVNHDTGDIAIGVLGNDCVKA